MESPEYLFEDRNEAGRALAYDLSDKKIECAVVVGIAKGGVPIAFEVSEYLELPMDILVVKKLSSPSNPLLALGAICSDGTRIVHPDAIETVGATTQYMDIEIEARLDEAVAEESDYRGDLIQLNLSGLAVVIVDDGIATGSTMEAAVLSMKRRGASKVSVATPIGSPRACEDLRRVADDVRCMFTPSDFWALGQFYLHFHPVSDDEVKQFLDQNRSGTLGIS